ncbi:hypothetical protein L3i23_13310 [Herbiconiux sp. L3-i23]|nr:hypothetical protein L3i23_13310 [Herbiconiux sp. L3-i23]
MPVSAVRDIERRLAELERGVLVRDKVEGVAVQSFHRVLEDLSQLQRELERIPRVMVPRRLRSRMQHLVDLIHRLPKEVRSGNGVPAQTRVTPEQPAQSTAIASPRSIPESQQGPISDNYHMDPRDK